MLACAAATNCSQGFFYLHMDQRVTAPSSLVVPLDTFFFSFSIATFCFYKLGFVLDVKVQIRFSLDSEVF